MVLYLLSAPDVFLNSKCPPRNSKDKFGSAITPLNTQTFAWTESQSTVYDLMRKARASDQGLDAGSYTFQCIWAWGKYPAACPICLSYFSAAVIEYYNQGNLGKKGLVGFMVPED